MHWGKHHRTYVTNLNNQLKDKPLANKDLEEVGFFVLSLHSVTAHQSGLSCAGTFVRTSKSRLFPELCERKQVDMLSCEVAQLSRGQ